MPCSRAARMVSMDSRSSLPPHIQPPMAQVPIAMRETSMDTPGIEAGCMSRTGNSCLLPMIVSWLGALGILKARQRGRRALVSRDFEDGIHAPGLDRRAL